MVYYSTPIHFSAPAPSYMPPPRFTDASYNPKTIRTSTYYPNHPSPAGPQFPGHQSTTGPQHQQVVTRPTYTYIPAQFNPPSQRRSLLTNLSRANHPTWTQNHAPYPYSNHTHVLYCTRTRGPLYSTNTKYIPSLTSSNLGPPEPRALPLREIGIGWEPRRTLRIAFRLNPEKRVPGKEGVPLGLFLQMGYRALQKIVEGPFERVLPYIYPRAEGVTLRFWSPVHPYGVEEYVVPTDAEGHYKKRLTLALHVARAYYGAAFSVPESHSSKNKNKNARLCKTKAIGPATTMSLDDLWLVSLRGTEREDVFDVCVHHHGPQSSSSYVW